jgi:hypothetical protein
MTDPTQLEKDVAALRSHVIDGIDDVKNAVESVEAGQAIQIRLLKQLFVVGCVIAALIALHLLRHW